MQPWEPQLGETVQAFEAFALYRDMGPDRSLAKVGRVLGKSKALMDRWSARWGWVERVAAWEAYLDGQRRQTYVTEVRRMSEEQATIGRFMTTKGARRLQDIPDDEVDTADAIRLVSEGVKTERLARGVSTDNFRHTMLTVEQAEEMVQALSALVLGLINYVPEGLRDDYRVDLERGLAIILGEGVAEEPAGGQAARPQLAPGS